VPDTPAQNVTQRLEKAPQFRIRQACRAAKGMNMCPPEGLVSVNVPDSGHHRLVHQQGFDLAVVFPDSLDEAVGGEIGRQGIWPERADDFTVIGGQPEAAELAGIAEEEIGSTLQM